MLHEIIIPSAGDSIKKCRVAKWHSQNGAFVKQGHLLVTLETEKIVQELEAEFSGQLSHLVNNGVVAYIGEEIGSIEHDGTEQPLPPLDTSNEDKFNIASRIKTTFMLFGILYLLEKLWSYFS